MLHQCIRPGFQFSIRNDKKESGLFSAKTVGYVQLWVSGMVHLFVTSSTSGFLIYTPPFRAERFFLAHRHSGVDGSSCQGLACSLARLFRGKKDVKVSVMKLLAYFPPHMEKKMLIAARWGFGEMPGTDTLSRNCLTLKGLRGDIHPIGAQWVHRTRWVPRSDVKEVHLRAFDMYICRNYHPCFMISLYAITWEENVSQYLQTITGWLASINISFASFKSAQWDINSDLQRITFWRDGNSRPSGN